MQDNAFQAMNNATARKTRKIDPAAEAEGATSPPFLKTLGARVNFSIRLMKRLANGMEVGLSGRVDEEPPSPVYTLLVQRLRGLETRELNAASAIIAERFGRRRDRRDRIALIGLRGAGKSTLGPLLAKSLNYEFVELSDEIATATGAGIDEIFELGGQAAYRRHGLQALRRLAARRAGRGIGG